MAALDDKPELKLVCNKLYDKLVHEYNSYFSAAEQQRLQQTGFFREEYSKLTLKAGNTGLFFGAKKFFPSIIPPHRLLQSRYEIFGIALVNDYSYNKREVEYAETKITEAYLDLVQLYWLGYLAFLVELAGQATAYSAFVDKFKSVVECKFLTNLIRYESDSFRLTEENRSELLRSFIVYYALGTCFSSLNEVDTLIRIKALKLWQKYDPNGQLFFFPGCRYDGYYNTKLANILPQSWAPELDPEQEYGSEVICQNQKYEQIFRSFDDGLTQLVIEYQAEMIQLCRTILSLEFDSTEHKLVLKTLFDLLSEDEATLELYFGSHASYRNKGQVTKFYDQLSNLSPKILAQMVRQQREEIKNLEDKIAQQKFLYGPQLNGFSNKLLLIKLYANQLLATLDKEVDREGYFSLFKLNPLFCWSVNLDNIKQMYHKYSRDYHPDRFANELKDEMTEKMQLVNQAYQTLSQKVSYDEYLNQCQSRAEQLAVKYLQLN